MEQYKFCQVLRWCRFSQLHTRVLAVQARIDCLSHLPSHHYPLSLPPHGIISIGHPSEHAIAVPQMPVPKWLTGDKLCVTQGSTHVTSMRYSLTHMSHAGGTAKGHPLNTVPHWDSTAASEGRRNPSSCGVIVHRLPPCLPNYISTTYAATALHFYTEWEHGTWAWQFLKWNTTDAVTE